MPPIHVHVAAALDHLGAVLDSTTITVDRAGYARLRDSVGAAPAGRLDRQIARA